MSLAHRAILLALAVTLLAVVEARKAYWRRRIPAAAEIP